MGYPNTPQDVADQMSGKFTAEQAKEVGNEMGIDWGQYDLEEFRMGMEVELEHGTKDEQTNVTDDDLVATGKIALAHLKELPDYYTRLAKMESAGKKAKESG